MRRLLLAVLIPIIAIIGTACDPNDPAQVRAFYELNPDVPAEELTAGTMNEAQRAVVKALQDRQTAFYLGIIASRQRPADCISAMKQVWPSSTWGWAEGIIRRESGNQPGAQNPSSTAAGCWQMLRMHDHRYATVGCSPAQKYDALCNNKAAYTLYQAAGTSPWSL